MANSLLTLNYITKEAIRLFRNSNAFVMNMDRQYSKEYANDGAKKGNTIRVRYPNDFTVTTGTVTASPQNTNEQFTNLTLSAQDHVDLQYSSQDLTLSIQDYSERILKPAVNNLAASVANTVMQGIEGGVCNYVANTSGGAVISPTNSTFLQANATLTQNGAPINDRIAILDPLTEARTVSTLAGLFNPQTSISENYESGTVRGPALGIQKWSSDQTVILHTTGAYAAMTVNGANQTGSAITVTATTGPLAKGDIITIAGVHAVNRLTKNSIGSLRQFTVTAAVATGATSIPIYPALIPGPNVQYQTVDASPANAAVITVVNQASEQFRKNFVMQKGAVTLATADLLMPRGVHDAARASYDGLSMRMVSQYNVISDEFVTRLDILYGFQYLRPEWACVVADAV